jgi:hypothetical protein
VEACARRSKPRWLSEFLLRLIQASLGATRHQNTRTPSRSIFAVASPMPLVPPMITARFAWYRCMRTLLATARGALRQDTISIDIIWPTSASQVIL